jgi:cell wall-associated NlpC family hydrolase
MPRRTFEICHSSPGILVIANTGAQVTDFARMHIGDLVFFDADPNDGPQIDHMGIYLGPDSSNQHRFISSRKTANGPSMGDVGGKSSLDGMGLYARSFRAVRRM